MLLMNLVKTPSTLFHSLFYCRGAKSLHHDVSFAWMVNIKFGIRMFFMLTVAKHYKIVFHVALYRSDTKVMVEGEVMGRLKLCSY
jgi:hypothetical protein